MANERRGQRASARLRRAALVQAAAELASEVGAGSVTHRAVAARAGVPLSTTSYFFSSIDELVTEALATSATGHIEGLDQVGRTAPAQAPDAHTQVNSRMAERGFIDGSRFHRRYHVARLRPTRLQ